MEIGSSVKPYPHKEKDLKTYIQEFLEKNKMMADISKYELKTVRVNVLNVERTFGDKILSVKRHAIDGTINKKVRHIYDVTQLYKLKEMQDFIAHKGYLKESNKLFVY
ncbi:nucleotidyl transferase AbiEii/AbiGii toxin family protein [Clostridium sp.]|uniref:nucleotidyl transferase AbiEii/AbiGii toxin family protein n=1 Tax=Clostridium sp. TaxID=1506 RepID=UPI003D6D37CC